MALEKLSAAGFMTRSENRLDAMQGQRESPQTSSSAAKRVPVMSRLWFAAQYPLLHLPVHLWFSSKFTILGKKNPKNQPNTFLFKCHFVISTKAGLCPDFWLHPAIYMSFKLLWSFPEAFKSCVGVSTG